MATIIREHKRGLGESTYLLRMKYGHADAKKALQNLAQSNKMMIQHPKKKETYVQLFCDNTLSFLPLRNSKPLAEWLFGMGLKNGYLTEVPQIWVGDAREYIISPTILSNSKK